MELSHELVCLLKSASALTVLTGSGISAESGVPTFRDAQTGLWARFRPEELATPEAFHADPALVWRWYQWRREMVRGARPNPAHLALVHLQRRLPGFRLVTQNVDGLHQRAGSRDVVEYHGNILRTRCSRAGCLPELPELPGEPPACPACGAPARPDVVWFGEAIPDAAQRAALQATAQCEVFMAIGTSGAVYPAAGLAQLARQQGAAFIELNPEPTPLSDQADFVLRGPAGLMLPQLALAAWGEEPGH